MCYWYENVLCVTGMRMSCLTFCALKNNIEFSLALLFMLVWLTVKTTKCMIIRKTLC